MVKFKAINEATIDNKPVVFAAFDESEKQIDLAATNQAIRLPLESCKHLFSVSTWGANRHGSSNDFDTNNIFSTNGRIVSQVQLVRNSHQVRRGNSDVTRSPYFFCSKDEGIGKKQDRFAKQVINGKEFTFVNAEYSEVYMPAHDFCAIGLLDFDGGSDTFSDYNPVANILVSSVDYDLEQLAKPLVVEQGKFSLFGGSKEPKTEINLLAPKANERRITVSFDKAAKQGDFMVFSLFIKTGNYVDIINVNSIYSAEAAGIRALQRMVNEYRQGV